MSARIHYMGDANTGPRGGGLYVFHCPACRYGHPFEVNAPNGQGWTWNGSLESPTFTPSLLIHGSDATPTKCHSFVTDGRIQFLADCTHGLAGQTVDIPDWDE